MTRKQVEELIAKFEVEANKKQMSLMLYDSKPDPDGFDISNDRLIFLTRIRLKAAEKFKESEFVAEIIKLSKGEVSDKIQALGVKDEDGDQLVQDLEEIEGVRSVRLSKYEAHIEKSRMFGWEEIIPKVLGTLEEFGLKKEFKIKGVTGVSGGNA